MPGLKMAAADPAKPPFPKFQSRKMTFYFETLEPARYDYHKNYLEEK